MHTLVAAGFQSSQDVSKLRAPARLTIRFERPILSFSAATGYPNPTCFVSDSGGSVHKLHIASSASPENPDGPVHPSFEAACDRRFGKPKKRRHPTRDRLYPYLTGFLGNGADLHQVVAGPRDRVLLQYWSDVIKIASLANKHEPSVVGHFTNPSACLIDETDSTTVIVADDSEDGSVYRYHVTDSGYVESTHMAVGLNTDIYGMTRASNRNRHLVAIYSNEAVHILDARHHGDEISWQRSIPTKEQFSVAFHPDGSYFAALEPEGQIRTYYVSGGERSTYFRDPAGRRLMRSSADRLLFSPQGDLLACQTDTAVHFFRTGHVVEGECAESIYFGEDERIVGSAFSECGRWFFVALVSRVTAYPAPAESISSFR